MVPRLRLSLGVPPPGPARGHLSIHRWVLSSHCAEHGQSIRGAHESGKGKPRSRLGGRPPLSADPHLLGKWRQQDSAWPGEKMGPQFGVHRASARLRRRDGPVKGPPNCRRPSSPVLPPVCAESGRGQAGLARGGPLASTFTPFPCWKLEAPKVLRAWLLRAGPATTGAPGPGVSSKQRPAGPGPEAQAAEKLVPARPGCPTPSPRPDAGSGAQWAQDMGRGEGLCQCGRGEDGEWTSREGRSAASLRSRSHNSHRSRGWMEAHVQDRQTDGRAH